MTLKAVIRALFTTTKGVVTGLSTNDANPDPIALFGTWFHEAQEAGLFLPESMVVATATPDGAPSARMMLLKGFDADGFVFYTNYSSRKAAELAANPQAALLFHWNILQRQVRIEGTVARISEAESKAYFRTRPRASRLSAWASRQSAELASRAELEESFARFKAKLSGEEIPLPPFWGGYRLTPERIEFWQGRLDRLHDRLLYSREGEGDNWSIVRLSP